MESFFICVAATALRVGHLRRRSMRQKKAQPGRLR
jgi:hypothetical protein